MMMTVKKFSLVFLSMTLFYMIVISIWGIDISIGAILTKGCVTNGIELCIDPVVFYHIHLRNLLMSVFGLIVVISYLLTEKKYIIKSDRC
jgi:hypothetical protein